MSNEVKIEELTAEHLGREVRYQGYKHGRIKSWNSSYVFVAFGATMEDFATVPSKACYPASLVFVSEPTEEEEEAEVDVEPTDNLFKAYAAFVKQKQSMVLRFKSKSGIDIQLCADEYPMVLLLHGQQGIANESGELAEIIKADLFYFKDSDVAHIMEELGDLLFFTQMIAGVLNVTLAEVIKGNIQKLNKRYKAGFSIEEAQTRHDKLPAEEN